MSRLNQNEDKSPAFASCHALAWTVHLGTLRGTWAAFNGSNRGWVWSQDKKVTCRLRPQRLGITWPSMQQPGSR